MVTIKSALQYLFAIIFILSQAVQLIAQAPVKSSQSGVSQKTLTEYTGVYSVHPHEKDCRKACRYFFSKGDTLFAQAKGGCRDALEKVSSDLFVLKADGPYYKFHRNSNGAVVSLEFYNNPNQFDAHQVEFKTSLALPKEKHAVVTDSAKLSLLQGKYDFGGEFSVIITLEKNKLYMEIPGEEKEEIFAENETRFFEEKVDGTIEFINQNGKVSGMIITRDIKYEGKKID